MAAAVHDDDAVSELQRGTRLAPIIGVGEPAVQQDNRRARPKLAYQILMPLTGA